MASLNKSLVVAGIIVQIAVILGGSCDWRYFQHYELKSCEPVLGPSGCPVRFKCNPLLEQDLETCIHNGKVYTRNEQIQDLGPCDSCRCLAESRGSSYIECAEVDCPDWDTKNKSCYMGYLPDQCCPVEICPGRETGNQKTCTYNGKDYKIGETIQVDDPCTSCLCTDKGKGNSGYTDCRKVNCLLGIYAAKIRIGCLPIYSETRCCPSTVNCDELLDATPVGDVGDDKDNHCYYQGKYYARGSTARLSDNYQCIACKCTTPPDFTCIRKRC